MTRKTADILSGLGFLILAAAFWAAGCDLTGISRIFPTMLEIFMALGGVALVLNGLRKGLTEMACEGTPTWRRIWLITASSILYVACMPLIGFYVSSALFLFIMAMVLGTRRDLAHAGLAAAFSVGLCVLVYVVFRMLLLVPTPAGALF
ncbi:MAG: tripartite tricarboxylate transporter TctB family protein [Desulfovibrionaceae bacterium]|jgi:hypothetical protein|nr:tripartite tricarboxylate transporter TctB family protein [Desulfovibrionaceae bacterium]